MMEIVSEGDEVTVGYNMSVNTGGRGADKSLAL
jgi:hypothetical protein